MDGPSLAARAIREAPDLHPKMMAGVLKLDGDCASALRETVAVAAVHARVRHGAPHWSRIVRNDSCSARLTTSQRFHASGSINSMMAF